MPKPLFSMALTYILEDHYYSERNLNGEINNRNVNNSRHTGLLKRIEVMTRRRSIREWRSPRCYGKRHLFLKRDFHLTAYHELGPKQHYPKRASPDCSNCCEACSSLGQGNGIRLARQLVPIQRAEIKLHAVSLVGIRRDGIERTDAVRLR